MFEVTSDAVVAAALDTGKLLRIILPAIFFGLLISSFIYSIPQFRRLVDAISRIMLAARLKSGVAIAAFLIHPVTAFSMLSRMREKGLIDDREVIIASLVGMFPRSVRLVIIFLAPVVIPALGVWGVLYIALILLTRIAIALAGIALAKRTLDGAEAVDFQTVPKDCLKDVLKRFARISTMLTVTIFLTMVAFNAGLLDFMNAFVPFFSCFGLPASSLLIIATGIPSMIAAIATAGSMVAKGALSGPDAVMALLFASILHTFVEILRNTFPIVASLFGKSLGVRIALITLFGRIVANILAITILVLLRAVTGM
ncbi:hypothetical protein [Archaeoglobus veneficus]|uniref:Nucleoside recognition domain protein n=1 Tax=Archaeoglobus veneficus (strain DSM 11195 / SNP6) TaxID=693661 RepID=F2KPG7_ARCVS|nr:hypothetical protein [Archaeoglobus veneficus]AEA46398.1 hypothetical protein Arcve_0365 [Archaeoglobus veneficus SNP6]